MLSVVFADSSKARGREKMRAKKTLPKQRF
jgi:hypothetical protein